MTANAQAASNFVGEITLAFEGSEDDFRTAIQAIALDALTRVVLKTPVLTGRARGNWSVGIGSVGGEARDVEDKSGSLTIAEGEQVLAQYAHQQGYPEIVLFNNLPYIERLENGYSTMAPNGMVAVTISELQPLVS